MTTPSKWELSHQKWPYHQYQCYPIKNDPPSIPMLSHQKRPYIKMAAIPSKPTPPSKSLRQTPPSAVMDLLSLQHSKSAVPHVFQNTAEHSVKFMELFLVCTMFISAVIVLLNLNPCLAGNNHKNTTRAARLISGTGPRDSRNPVFKELGWLSLENRRCMHKCTMNFKCRNGLAPLYLIDSFNANTFNHSYRTRNSSILRIPIAI